MNGLIVGNSKIEPFSNLQSVIVAPDIMKQELLSQAHDDAGDQGIEVPSLVYFLSQMKISIHHGIMTSFIVTFCY